MVTGKGCVCVSGGGGVLCVLACIFYLSKYVKLLIYLKPHFCFPVNNLMTQDIK